MDETNFRRISLCFILLVAISFFTFDTEDIFNLDKILPYGSLLFGTQLIFFYQFRIIREYWKENNIVYRNFKYQISQKFNEFDNQLPLLEKLYLETYRMSLIQDVRTDLQLLESVPKEIKYGDDNVIIALLEEGLISYLKRNKLFSKSDKKIFKRIKQLSKFYDKGQNQWITFYNRYKASYYVIPVKYNPLISIKNTFLELVGLFFAVYGFIVIDLNLLAKFVFILLYISSDLIASWFGSKDDVTKEINFHGILIESFSNMEKRLDI